jgi:hypothetical protein
VRVRPEGAVTILDSNGTELFNVPVTMGSVYAVDETRIEFGLPSALPEGTYSVQVDLIDPETQAAASTEQPLVSLAPATPVASTSVQLLEVAGIARPDLESIQFLDISLTIDNPTEAIPNAQVVLRASKDGEAVEDFPLATAIELGSGTTTLQYRYIPATGWTEGTWTFEVIVERVDTASGIAEVLVAGEIASIAVTA